MSAKNLVEFQQWWDGGDTFHGGSLFIDPDIVVSVRSGGGSAASMAVISTSASQDFIVDLSPEEAMKKLLGYCGEQTIEGQ